MVDVLSMLILRTKYDDYICLRTGRWLLVILVAVKARHQSNTAIIPLHFLRDMRFNCVMTLSMSFSPMRYLHL